MLSHNDHDNRDDLPIPPADSARRVEQLESEIDRLIDAADRTKSETAMEFAQLENRQMDLGTELQSAKRTARTLWAAVVVLAAGVIAVSWLSFPSLQKHASLLAGLPSLQKTLDSAGDRLDSAEEKLRGWTSHQDVLTGRLTKLENRVTAIRQLTRRESAQLAARFSQTLQAEMDKRMGPVQARLNQLESGQNAEQARVAKLRDDVDGLRGETSQQLALARQDSSRDIASVDREVTSNRRDFDNFSRRLDHDRVDFEAAKNETSELAPGISLHVTHTNTGQQNIDGRLELIPDGKTLWVRGQDIEQPLAFFTQRDDRPYELVFTRVTNDDAIGYLLVPAQIDNSSPSTADSRRISNSAALAR